MVLQFIFLLRDCDSYIYGKRSRFEETRRARWWVVFHWNFACWPRRNVQVCIFASGEFVFHLRRPLSMALLLLSHVFESENFSEI